MEILSITSEGKIEETLCKVINASLNINLWKKRELKKHRVFSRTPQSILAWNN